MKRLIYLLLALTMLAPGTTQAATKAQSIQFLLSQVRTSTSSLAGGKAYFYVAGATTTPKAVWLDRGKQTQAANPYTLDSNATAQLFGDGLYRIVIKDAAGVTKYDRDGLRFAELDGDTVANVLDYGAGTLSEAIAAIGSTPTTLAYGTDQTLSANTAIPETLELMPLNGAVINHGTYTISYAGSTARWPLSQIFNGTGLVTLAAASEIKAEWFSSLARADAAAVAAGKLLVLSSQWDTVPTTLNASIKIIPGGKLNGSGSVAISGVFEGCDGCFGASQTVTGLKEARPELFGVNTIPGTTDMTTAMNSAHASGAKVIYGKTTYRFNGSNLDFSGGIAVGTEPAYTAPDGVYTARFNHRAGDLQYQVLSGGYARLLSSLEKHKPRAIPELAFRVKYVDGVNGLDTNDGLTWATAQKSIRFCVNQNATDIVYIAKGVYYEEAYTWNKTMNISLIAVGGQVEIVYGSLNTATYGAWATDATYTNVRVLNVSAGGVATSVVDRQYSTLRGPVRFTQAASLALCNSTPNTFYQAAGNAPVYVHRGNNSGDIVGDGVVVSTDNQWVFQLRDATQAGETGPTKVFMKGITIYGGVVNLLVQSFNNTPATDTVFFAEDCRFIASSGGNALSVLDIGLAIIVRSGSTKSQRDGFNYTAANSQSPHAIEIDCFAHDNGWGGESNNNGSTGHEDVRIFRLNTQVNYSSGPAIADTGNAKSWNVSCLSELGSTSALSLSLNAEGWVHGGHYSGTRADVNGGRRDIRVQDSAIAHLRRVTAGSPPYAQDGTALIDGEGWD